MSELVLNLADDAAAEASRLDAVAQGAATQWLARQTFAGLLDKANAEPGLALLMLFPTADAAATPAKTAFMPIVDIEAMTGVEVPGFRYTKSNALVVVVVLCGAKHGDAESTYVATFVYSDTGAVSKEVGDATLAAGAPAAAAAGGEPVGTKKDKRGRDSA